MSYLSQTKIWEISAAILHTPSYRRDYANAIAKVIRNHKASILDTACGTGFPALDLYKIGFKKMVCSDGDAKSAKSLTVLFRKEHINIPVLVSRWQDLSKNIDTKFDFVVNVDNSIVYLDGWWENTTYNPKTSFQRLAEVLKQFYSMLKPEGIAIIGSCATFPKTITEKIYREKGAIYKGREIRTIWHTKYDWKHRIREWTPSINYNGRLLRRTIKSYLIKKQEFVDLVKKAGFDDVRVIDIRTREINDYLYIGHKKGSG